MLRHWFSYNEINWSNLSGNKSHHAVHLLSLPENFDKINWTKLSQNPFAVDLLLKHPEKIKWSSLCLNINPKAVYLILQAFKRGETKKFDWLNICRNHCPDIFPLLEYIVQSIDNYSVRDYDEELYYLSANPVAISLFLCPEHYEKICWTGMCMNTSKKAIELLSKRENYHRLERHVLALNPSAFSLLLKEYEYNPERIDWSCLAFNSNPQAIKLLEQNPDKIVWYLLTGNKSKEAFELIKKNLNMVSWTMLLDNPHALEMIQGLKYGNLNKYHWAILSSNPEIFVEWKNVKKRPFSEELLQEALNPRRVAAIYNRFGSLDGYI